MKNLESMLARQVLYALIPLAEMTCRSAQWVNLTHTPISLAGVK